MSRRPAIRDNYRQDAITIHRIIGAIELDEVSPPDWKTSVTVPLEQAMRLMLEHSTLTAPKLKKVV